MVKPHPLPAMANAVVIVSAAHAVPIKKRLSGVASITVVSEAELLKAHDAIVARPPDVLVMDPTFAATSRGAALVAAIRAQPCKTGTTIRVFLEDEAKIPLILSETTLPAGEALLGGSRPLDRAGTRQAARYPMNRRDVAINGDTGQLIDLSVSGAQIELTTRPLKVARLVVPNQKEDIRLQCTVAWAIAVPTAGTIHYRAGVEFVNPDQQQLASFCAKYGGAPDPTLANTGAAANRR